MSHQYPFIFSYEHEGQCIFQTVMIESTRTRSKRYVIRAKTSNEEPFKEIINSDLLLEKQGYEDGIEGFLKRTAQQANVLDGYEYAFQAFITEIGNLSAVIAFLTLLSDDDIIDWGDVISFQKKYGNPEIVIPYIWDEESDPIKAMIETFPQLKIEHLKMRY